MNTEILNWLKRDGSEMPSDVCPILGSLIYDWRDRLQTEENRTLLIDNLSLENSYNESKIEDRKNKLLTFGTDILNNTIFPLISVSSIIELEDKLVLAMITDSIRPFPEVHDFIGASGFTSICTILQNNDLLASCMSVIRLYRGELSEICKILQQSLISLILDLLK